MAGERTAAGGEMMYWINGEPFTKAGYYAWHIGGAITPALIVLGYIGIIALVVFCSPEASSKGDGE